MVAAGVLTAGSCLRPPVRPVFPQPPASPQPVLELWLQKSCKVGEDNGLEKAMRRFGPQLTPPLIAAFQAGPAEKDENIVANQAKTQLLEMQRRIGAGDSLGLRKEDAGRIRRLDPDQHSRQALEEFQLSYRSSALAGLGAVRTPEAVAYLQKEAADPQSRFRDLARSILRQIKRPVKSSAGQTAP